MYLVIETRSTYAVVLALERRNDDGEDLIEGSSAKVMCAPVRGIHPRPLWLAHSVDMGAILRL